MKTPIIQDGPAKVVGSGAGFGEVDALTRYIVTSALIYSQGQWSGEDVAKDMIRGGGITRAEINRVTKDKDARRKLRSFLPNTKVCRARRILKSL